LEKSETAPVALKCNCPFLSAEGACGPISAGVGLPIIIEPSACQYCAETTPKPEGRHQSPVVLQWIYGQRRSRGMPADKPKRKPTTETAKREHKQRSNIADQLLAVARTVPKRAPAPVVESGEDRLEICETCPAGKWQRGKCVAGCACRNRPRPLAEDGKDCPLRFWRRA
jgi:hypothetical protein